MEEQKPITQEVKPVEAAGMIDKAVAAAARLEEANKKHEELLNRQETLAAKQMLAGKAEAGAAPVQAPVENAKAYAERVMSGKVVIK